LKGRFSVRRFTAIGGQSVQGIVQMMHGAQHHQPRRKVRWFTVVDRDSYSSCGACRSCW